MYIPPFTISAEAINLIAEISGQIERYAIRMEQEDGLRLRKANRIKTIHSSLAIEGNTLSEDEVRDIIDGKNVVAPLKQILEVKNAITASTNAGQSGPFIDFMLNEIYKTLKDHQGEELPTNNANPIDRQFGIKFGEEFGIKCGIKFGINDKQLLLLIDDNPTITASDAAERMAISLRGAEKIFKKLKDVGAISREGSRKSGSWVINK